MCLGAEQSAGYSAKRHFLELVNWLHLRSQALVKPERAKYVIFVLL